MSAERLVAERRVIELEQAIHQLETSAISGPEIRVESAMAVQAEIANMIDYGSLDFREPEKAGRRIERMSLDVVASILTRIRNDKAAAALSYVRAERVEMILDAMEPNCARRIRSHMNSG